MVAGSKAARIGLALILLDLLIAPSATAQLRPDTTAMDTLKGRVTVVGSGDPVAAARVRLAGNGRIASTDSTGRFRLPLLRVDSVRVQLRHREVGRRDTVLQVQSGDAPYLDWKIPVPAYRMPDIGVEIRDPGLAGTGFYRRRSDGRGGFFMDRDSLQIPRYENVPLRGILRGTPEALFRDVFEGCTTLYVDGEHVTSPGIKRWALQELRQDEIAGVGVLGPGEAPLKWQRGDPTECVVLLVWTEGD